MTNKEYYKERIFEIACQGYSIAFDERTNKMVECAGLFCEYCKFWSEGKCEETISKWLEEEYVEDEDIDWTEVEVDTKILVRNHQNAE